MFAPGVMHEKTLAGDFFFQLAAWKGPRVLVAANLAFETAQKGPRVALHPLLEWKLS